MDIQHNDDKIAELRNRIAFLEDANSAILEFLSQVESLQDSQEKMDLSLGFSRIVDHFLHEIQRVIPTNSQALVLVDQNSQEFKIHNASPNNTRSEYEQELDYQIENGVFPWVLNHRKITIVPSHYFVENGQKNNIVMLPLHIRKKILGMLFIETSLSHDISTQGMFNILTILSSQFSLALDNITLYQNIENYNTMLETMVKERTRKLEKLNIKLQQANEELTIADRLKSEFLANTSHELRTPLNSIIGLLQLIQDGMCNSREEEQEFISNVIDSSYHLLTLIDDVLDIAKIEAGKIKLNIVTTNLKDIFDEIYLLTHVQAEQKKINLTFTTIDNNSIFVKADIQKLKQVLLNLVGNAIKFTQKGKIEITAIAIFNKKLAEINIKDTGIGVPIDRQEHIFDKFVQGDGSTSRRYGGAGLGLAITKSLVEQMEGKIELSSGGSGRGTSVTFTLPLSEKSTEKAPGIPQYNQGAIKNTGCRK